MNKIGLILLILLLTLFACRDKNLQKENQLIQREKSFGEMEYKKYIVQNPLDEIDLPDSNYCIDVSFLNRSSNMGFRVYKYLNLGYGSILYWYCLFDGDHPKQQIGIFEYPSEPDEFHQTRIYIKKVGTNQSGKACYLRWVNRSTTHEILVKGVHLDNPFYVWGIGSFTDTVYSNLNERIIRNTYPDFKGIVRKDDIRQITINYQYFPDKNDFYENIKFIK